MTQDATEAQYMAFHEDSLMDYALGRLSPAKHMIITCLNEISPDVSRRVAFHEDIAASALEDVKEQSLSPSFMSNALARIAATDGPKPSCSGPDRSGQARAPARQGTEPKTLRHMLGQGLEDMKWSSLIPGIAVHDILGSRRYDKGDRLYLLRAKGGMQLPEHSHSGEEWTLILAGSYTVDGKVFSRGDLHIEDERESHAPYVNEGEDCVCLVMTQGPLIMKSLMAKMVQKVVGI